MADTIRNVVIKLAIQQQPAAVKVPDFSPAVQAAEEAGKEMAAAQTKGLTVAEAAVSKAIGANNRYIENVFQVGDSTKQAVEGLSKAAVAYALLFTSTEEGYKQLVDNIRMFKGGFDIVIGGYEVLKNLTVAYRVATAAAAANAVVSGTVATANTAVTLTAGTATVAVNGLKAALSPALLAIAAVGTGLTIASYAMASYKEETSETVDTNNEFTESLTRTRTILGQLSNFNVNLEIESEILAMKEGVTFAERLLENEKRRKEIQSQIFQINTAEHVNKFRDRDANDAERRASMQVLKGEIDLRQKLVETDKDRLKLQREQQAALQTTLDKTNAIYEAAKSAADQERNRLGSIQAGLGKLDPIQQAELKRLGEKQKSGTLTDQDVSRLESGFGQIEPIAKFVEGRNRQRGLGRESLIEPFNNGVNLTGQGSKIQDLSRKEVEAFRQRAEAAEAALTQKIEADIDIQMVLPRLFEKMKQAFAVKGSIERIEAEIDKLSVQGHLRDVGRNQH